jgi:CheY-like chemotaxis protein
MRTSFRASQRIAIMANEAPRVLVVDDDHDTVDSFVTLLNLFGYQTDATYDAKTALKIAGIRRPRAVLLDVAMPGGDGYHLARALRQIPGLENALLICITGYGMAADKRQCRRAGCDYHFLKPVDWDEVIQVLQQIGAPEHLAWHAMADDERVAGAGRRPLEFAPARN